MEYTICVNRRAFEKEGEEVEYKHRRVFAYVFLRINNGKIYQESNF